MPTTKIYAARHGETELNAQRLVCGATDLPLTDNGIAQAHKLAEHLLDKGIELIFCSDMIRARQTAEVVGNALGIQPIADHRLHEFNFGSMEKCSWDDEEFLRRKQVFAERFPDGGESILEGAHRVYSFLDEMLVSCGGKTLLIVSHGWTNRFIATYFRDLTNEQFAKFGMSNCECAKYEIDL
jgi:probable phosphoglycerate mutase